MSADESHLHEHPHDAELYPPPSEVSQGAHISSISEYRQMYKRSIEEPDEFWKEISAGFHWNK